VKEPDSEFVGGAVLIGTSALLLVTAGVTGRGDLTSATLVLLGVGCFIGGVLLISQRRGESVLSWVAGLGYAGPIIDLARLCADLGIQGNAHFFPGTGEIVQIIPPGENSPLSIPPDDYSYITEDDGGGIRLVPTGQPILTRLVNQYSLVVPDNPEGIKISIQEVAEEALEIAESVEVMFEGEMIDIRLRGFILFEGCSTVRAASPKVCTMIGCPICSLFACMVVAGLGHPCWIEHVSVDNDERTVRLLLHLIGATFFTPTTKIEADRDKSDANHPVSNVTQEGVRDWDGQNSESAILQ